MKKRGGRVSAAFRRIRQREFLRRTLVWGARIGVLVLAGLFIWASLEVRSSVQKEPRFDLSRWELGLGELPGWAPRELRDELEGMAICGNREEPLTIFTPGVLAKVRNQILQCSWVRDVRWIRLRAPGIGSRSDFAGAVSADSTPGGTRLSRSGRAFNGSINMELELRVPIALVRVGDFYYIADRDCVRMGPALDAERAGELALPAIEGGEPMRSRLPPPAGCAWEDRDVREGLDVAEILFDEGIAQEFPRIPIEKIDITNLVRRTSTNESEIILVAPGLRLAWGRSPMSAGARTQEVSGILENLRKVLRNPEKYFYFSLVLLYTRRMVGYPPEPGA